MSDHDHTPKSGALASITYSLMPDPPSHLFWRTFPMRDQKGTVLIMLCVENDYEAHIVDMQKIATDMYGVRAVTEAGQRMLDKEKSR